MVNPLYYLFASFISMLYPLGIEPLAILRPEYGVLALPLIGRVDSIPLAILLLTFVYGAICALAYSRATSLNLHRVARRLRFTALAIFIVEIFVAHLPSYVGVDLGLKRYLLLPALTSLLPLFLMAAINGALSLRASSLLRSGVTFRGGAAFNLQGFIAFAFVPLTIIMLFNELLSSSADLNRLLTVYPVTGWLFAVVFITLFLVFTPLLIRLLLTAKPIPPGELRDRLMALCRKANVECRDLLVWKTYGATVGNAFITGIVGQCRYIFFTDYLLANLSVENVEAVISHEIGHAKRGHTTIYLLFALSYITLLTFFYERVLSSFHDNAAVAVIMLIFAVLFWVVVFGYASRRFEMEADLFGAQLVGSAIVFIQALRKIAIINNIPAEFKSLQHFSIGRRTFLLHLAETDPLYRQRMERSSRLLKRGIVCALILSIFCESLSVFDQIRTKAEREDRWNVAVTAENGIDAYRLG
ncbi:MAG: M48 family metalloprotease, partial [Desulfatitalea sp.]|nr:M48 family metalloprotease [Desulfatitalea sp.]